MDIMRKLVTIERIDEVLPIEGADAIVLVKVKGWQCVAKVGEFKVGDLCVYFEIDSFLPVIPMFEFLRKSSFKRMGELEGFRIKTIRLRNQLSQGLALPLSVLGKPEEVFTIGEGCIGAEVTEDLGVKKYEPPVPVELAGQIRGNFPSFIKKTDQERCQNIGPEIFVENEGSRYEVTMKMDGTSFTAFYADEEEGVCGRNWELQLDGKNDGNALVRMFINSGLQAALRGLGLNYAVQGELMGPGIQGNREGLKAHRLFVFDIYDIDGGCYLAPDARHRVMDELWAVGMSRQMVEHAPVIERNATLSSLGITTVAQLLAFAEGPSYLHPIREGFVFKREDGGFSFKAISNKFLLKEKD
jgi:RNA ligase (TIGR02306 family)